MTSKTPGNLTAREASERCGLSVHYIKRQHYAGNLPALGKNAVGWIMFDPQVVDDWNAARLAKQGALREVVTDDAETGQEDS